MRTPGRPQPIHTSSPRAEPRAHNTPAPARASEPDEALSSSSASLSEIMSLETTCSPRRPRGLLLRPDPPLVRDPRFLLPPCEPTSDQSQVTGQQAGQDPPLLPGQRIGPPIAHTPSHSNRKQPNQW
jgi:hypothetical protein